VAVGWTNKAVLSDEWAGEKWTLMKSASSSYSPVRLFGVDCLYPELSDCTGVGWGTSSGTELTMSEEFTKTGGWVAASTKIQARRGTSSRLSGAGERASASV
jgi:hypothetical protein